MRPINLLAGLSEKQPRRLRPPLAATNRRRRAGFAMSPRRTLP